MSEKCQDGIGESFDHLVGACQQRKWKCYAERFGRLLIENQFDFDCLHDGQL